MFDWVEFLNQRGVESVDRGNNVSRGDIAIRCPFCGNADPSQHMVISLSGRGWHCWRNHDHRGRSPVKLVQALAGCSYEQAQTIVHGENGLPHDYLEKMRSILDPQPRTQTHDVLQLPSEFKPLRIELPSSRPFINYLKRRGFTPAQIATMHQRYDLYYCTRGDFQGRIIFPLTINGRTFAWTGRTISDLEYLRYKTEGPIGHYLLWADRLVGDTIVLVEGPFDALKVTVLGRKRGVCSTCFFTSAPNTSQVELLHNLLPKFRKRYLMLDEGSVTLPNALRVSALMAHLGVQIKHLPADVKDPGELNARQMLSLFP